MLIEFTEYNSWKYPEKLRLVKFYDEEQGRGVCLRQMLFI